MSMSTHVVGFKPPDDKWRKMKGIWDSCEEAGINPPKDVNDYFGGEAPGPAGVEVDEDALIECGAVKEHDGDMEDGYEIDVTKLPKDVKIIRVYNSY